MNTLKTVFGKLFKEETKLASHEVELALIDDLKKILDKSKNSYNEFNDSFQKFVDYRRLVTAQGETYSKDAEQLINLFQSASQQAKELGLDFNSTQIAKDAKSLIAGGDPTVIRRTISQINK